MSMTIKGIGATSNYNNSTSFGARRLPKKPLVGSGYDFSVILKPDERIKGEILAEKLEKLSPARKERVADLDKQIAQLDHEIAGFEELLRQTKDTKGKFYLANSQDLAMLINTRSILEAQREGVINGTVKLSFTR